MPGARLRYTYPWGNHTSVVLHRTGEKIRELALVNHVTATAKNRQAVSPSGQPGQSDRICKPLHRAEQAPLREKNSRGRKSTNGVHGCGDTITSCVFPRKRVLNDNRATNISEITQMQCFPSSTNVGSHNDESLTPFSSRNHTEHCCMVSVASALSLGTSCFSQTLPASRPLCLTVLPARPVTCPGCQAKNERKRGWLAAAMQVR